MVSNYKRRTTQSAYGPDVLQKALEAVKGGMSKNKASKQYGVPRRTINRHLAGKVMKPLCKLGRFVPALTAELESALEQHILEMQQMMFGLSCADVRKLAFKLAVKKGLPHPFSCDKQQAGKAWLQGFLQRHPSISVRNPEATNLSRAVGFNKPTVMKFFDMYKCELEKYCYTADRIWNVDETGISSVHVPGKVLAKKGQRQVGRVTSGEKGDNLTVICAINAAGSYAPPMLIFKRKRMSHLLMAGTPSGSVGYPSASGWVTNELFVKWLEHFIGFANPTVDNKVILLLDGHASHKTLEAVELCRENGVVLICLPPHTTHQMQPLDKTVYGPMKKNYNEQCDRWMLKNPAQRITMFEQGELFGAAFVKTAGMQKAVNGFEKTGLWPFNPDVFCDEDFLPCQVTDEPEPVSAENIVESENISTTATNTDATVTKDADASLVLTAVGGPAGSSELNSTVVATGPSGLVGLSDIDTVSSGLLNSSSSETVTSSAQTPTPTNNMEQAAVSNAPDQSGVVDLNDSDAVGSRLLNIRNSEQATSVSAEPSTSSNSLGQATVSNPIDVIREISPLPKCHKQRIRKRKPQTAAVLTSSPFKKQLLERKPPPKCSKKETGKKVTCRGQKEKARKLSLPRAPKRRKVDKQCREFRCIYCSELFVDPPEEDWMQCIVCKEWYHEQCGNDADICDLCKDSQ